MSDTVDPKAAWCQRARKMLDNKALKSGEVHVALANAKQVFNAKPDELTDAEWTEYEDSRDALDQLNKTGDAKVANRKYPMRARDDAEAFVTQTEDLVKQIGARKETFAKVAAHPRLAKLTDAAQTSLKQLDDPQAALDAADVADAAGRAVGSKFATVSGYFDRAEGETLAKSFSTALSKLDLTQGEELKGRMARLLAEAEQEKREVTALKQAHAEDADAPKKADTAEWRKLAKAEREFARLSRLIARAITEGEQSKLDSKKQQVAAIRGAIEDAIKDWPSASITDKLNESGHKAGNLVWLQARLGLLQAPTAANPEQIEAARLKADWDMLKDDVDTRWTAYVASNYSPALRGPFAPGAVLTDRIQTALKITNSFTAADRTFRKSPSDTTGISYHTDIPQAYQGYNAAGQWMASFIYHI